ncbi:MAG: peptidoglycan-binding protein, partial [Ruthenibacterium sp.]
DIFNTYVRRTGTVEPYYTEYCDGKTVTCPGMKQWGTVTLANQGKTAFEILRAYYGSNIEIVRTNNIAAIPESYPGTPLRVGSTGMSVRILQRQLNRIAIISPVFGTLGVDGNYTDATAAVVRKFQKQFSLTQDGIVGRATWYKISSIYVAVKKLAELTSEGEKPSGDLVAGTYPGAPLRVGSAGDTVLEMQFWLNEVAGVTPDIPSLTVDGIFGAGTERSVRALQHRYGLSEDGIVGKQTWDIFF